MPRNVLRSLRLSRSELATIEARAAQANIGVSAYLRSTALSQPLTYRARNTQDDLLRHDLSRLALLISQSDIELADEVRAILQRLA